jgi:hypothetical protein
MLVHLNSPSFISLTTAFTTKEIRLAAKKEEEKEEVG